MNLEPKKLVAEPKSETQSKLERGDQEVYEPEGHRNTFYWWPQLFTLNMPVKTLPCANMC